jgi:hypothetical protein
MLASRYEYDCIGTMHRANRAMASTFCCSGKHDVKKHRIKQLMWMCIQEQELAIKYTLELQLKSQEIRALTRRVETLQSNLRASFDGDTNAIQRVSE